MCALVVVCVPLRRSSGCCLTLVFRSSLGAVRSGGFNASFAPLPLPRYYLEDSCPGPTYIHTSDFAELVYSRQDTYEEGGYSPPFDCQVVVVGAPTVRVPFTRFFVDNFVDYLTLYDGNSTASAVMATLTGAAAPTTYTSTGPAVLVWFRQANSNGGGVFYGFAAAIASSLLDISANCPSNALLVYPGVGATDVSASSYANNLSCKVLMQSSTNVTVAFTTFSTQLYVPRQWSGSLNAALFVYTQLGCGVWVKQA